ncbi:thermonuclease family protein [Patescibacteria group bacterium]|nr:thermonuclease family protein [Patescibacteria group bacterium]
MKKEDKEKLKIYRPLLLKIAIVLGAIISVLTLTGTHEALRKWLSGFLLIILAILVALYQGESDFNSEIVPENDSNFGEVVRLVDRDTIEINSEIVPETGSNLVEVVRVIDGDTIIVEGNREVRLIGVDAPESGECFFQESKEALTELIEGKNVELKRDISGMDDFGRLLRYVFLPSDSEYIDKIFVNRYVLEQGCADIMKLSQNREYRRLLTSSRNEALTERKGMWGACENREEKAESFYPLEANDQPTDPKCLIKGNISGHGLGKTYFPLGCSNYEKVKVSFDKGEQFFCTEEEAIEAGFAKSGSCK